jgi:hypothetical protein
MKLSRKYTIGLIVIIVCGIAFPHIKMLIEGDRGKIKRIIYAARRATEKEDAFKCISFVSTVYDDEYGNNRQSLFLIAKDFFEYYDTITVGIQDLTIAVEEERAEAELKARIIGQTPEREQANVFETEIILFRVYFKLEKTGWKVVRMEFLEVQPFLPPGTA